MATVALAGSPLPNLALFLQTPATNPAFKKPLAPATTTTTTTPPAAAEDAIVAVCTTAELLVHAEMIASWTGGNKDLGDIEFTRKEWASLTRTLKPALFEALLARHYPKHFLPHLLHVIGTVCRSRSRHAQKTGTSTGGWQEINQADATFAEAADGGTPAPGSLDTPNHTHAPRTPRQAATATARYQTGSAVTTAAATAARGRAGKAAVRHAYVFSLALCKVAIQAPVPPPTLHLLHYPFKPLPLLLFL